MRPKWLGGWGFDVPTVRDLLGHDEESEKVEQKNQYGVYQIEGTKNNPRQRAVFKMKGSEELLDRMGILDMWQKTETGQPSTDDEEVFEPMAKLHPYLEDLRQARKSLNDLGRFGSYLGKDGNNRAAMFSFGTVTGRNSPKARAFLLSRPHWVRNLITPREGMAIVHAVGAHYCDLHLPHQLGKLWHALVLRLLPALIRASRVLPSTPPLFHKVERHFFDGQFGGFSVSATRVIARFGNCLAQL